MVDDHKDLLSKLDIPFFNNNLEYINLWITYYQTTKDIGILFLMKYKKISNDYYWLYLELANFYKKKGKEGLSVYILQKGIENKVYKNEILIEVLKNYEGIEPVTENYAHKYLYPKGFKALKKIWNEFINVNYCKEGILKNGTECISLEEYRFLSRKSGWVINRGCMKIECMRGCGEEGCMRGNGEECCVKGECIKTDKGRIKAEDVVGEGIKAEEYMKGESMKDINTVTPIAEINLIQFFTSLNCSPKEQAVILEFWLLQILICISENKESPQTIDFEN
ncbi:hypothetical protein NBO_64g0059 [Nosema bombycis CQ1]|uniref:Uncharacterized protein n=1 Tax=Nosema bombycis (strain CQ1 / CVCC 102059) TaxID=578461 RepID=R0MLH0_NOSB1|nr:hypothetical protein NBO_64g0059 [Nosema bombycis CQ1]|eukprot:EOB13678.1 hypothetical protein NBO_64g0059 [Nosema bombycis CQ1]